MYNSFILSHLKLNLKKKTGSSGACIFTAQAAVAGSYLSQRSFGDTGLTDDESLFSSTDSTNW